MAEIGAVQKTAHLVDLENTENQYLLAKIGVDTAENGPKVDE